VDEAFLRRIPYKINVVDPTEEEFRELFRMMCRSLSIEYDEETVSYLIDEYYHKTGRSFRCCQPRDLLTIIRNQSKYGGEPLALGRESIDFATKVYFAVM
jgi:SpoVK/Ycf46/Vps4 family AAA+-type ATPase